MVTALIRNHRFSHDLQALSPWFCVAFLLFLIGALSTVPDRHKPLLWLPAALCTIIGFLTR